MLEMVFSCRRAKYLFPLFRNREQALIHSDARSVVKLCTLYPHVACSSHLEHEKREKKNNTAKFIAKQNFKQQKIKVFLSFSSLLLLMLHHNFLYYFIMMLLLLADERSQHDDINK